jgi:hypothetical protein
MTFAMYLVARGMPEPRVSGERGQGRTVFMFEDKDELCRSLLCEYQSNGAVGIQDFLQATHTVRRLLDEQFGPRS